MVYGGGGEGYWYVWGEKMVKYREEEIVEVMVKDYKGKGI